MTARCWDGRRHFWTSGYCLACGRTRAQLRRMSSPQPQRRAVPLGALLAALVLITLLPIVALAASHVGETTSTEANREVTTASTPTESSVSPALFDPLAAPANFGDVSRRFGGYLAPGPGIPTVEEAFAADRATHSAREAACLREIAEHESLRSARARIAARHIEDPVDRAAAFEVLAVTITNRSGAYGIPQAMPGADGVPGSKMASAQTVTDPPGAWKKRADIQVRWMRWYVMDRYGTACGFSYIEDGEWKIGGAAALRFGACTVGRRTLIAGIDIPHQDTPSRPGEAGAACRAKGGTYHAGRGWY